MRRAVALYRALMRVTLLLQLQWRAALVIWLLGLVAAPVVNLAVWTNVAAANGGSVGGYTASTFAAYFLAQMLVNHLTFSWMAEVTEYRVRQGLLAPLLLRPMHPIHRDVADNIAYKALALVVLLPALVVLALVFRPVYAPTPWSLAALVPAVLLAFGLRFLVEWTLSLVAFWVTRVAAVNQLYYATLLFFSGMAVPLALLPLPLQALSYALPFRWMIAFPVELALGRPTPTETLAGLVAQLLWLLAAYALMRAVWRVGIRRFSAVGA